MTTQSVLLNDSPMQVFRKKVADNKDWIERCERILNPREFLFDELEINRVLFELKVYTSYYTKKILILFLYNGVLETGFYRNKFIKLLFLFNTGYFFFVLDGFQI